MRVLATILVATVFLSCEPSVRNMNSNQQTIGTSWSSDRDRSQLTNRARASGFEDIESLQLAENDIEFRIWATGGFASTRGVIASKRDRKWSSYFLPALEGPGKEVNAIDLSDRSNDWEAIAQGIIDVSSTWIREARQMPEPVPFLDGQEVVVQIKRGDGLKVTLLSTEPCAQNDELGELLCSLVRDIKASIEVDLLVLP